MQPKTRRTVLALGGLAAVGVGFPRVHAMLNRDFTFERMEAPNGFRRLRLNEVSQGPSLFAGLDGENTRPAPTQIAALNADPCADLFDHGSPAQVPIAVFTDYYCPYCRVLSHHLLTRKDDLALTWHELPLLSRDSEPAARLALAASQQVPYVDVHAYLMKTSLRPTPAFLRRFAADLGLNERYLRRDRDSADVTAHIERSHALAYVFGLYGTPATIVGRTLVIGAIKPADLDRLIALEQAEGQHCKATA